MPCINCFNGCAEITSDKCIKYTGTDVTQLNICAGDNLFNVNEDIIAKILTLITGTGITPSVTLACDLVKNALGTSTATLPNILQALSTAICTLSTTVTTLSTTVNKPYSFNISCLTGLPTSPTSNDILQATLTKVCSISTTVNALPTTYVQIANLNTLIAAYLTSTSSTVQQSTKMVPYVAYEYYGSLSNFDSNGAGLASAGFTKVYICNGSNGTPDKRGRVAVGAIQNVPGGAMDAQVNPSLPANAGFNYALKDKFGTSTVTLDVTQMPSHTHSVTDPGHNHSSTGLPKGGRDGNNVIGYEAGALTKATTTSFTGITLSSTGGNLPHDNRQPSIAAYFIMFIP